MTQVLLTIAAGLVAWSLFVWLVVPPVAAFIANRLWKPEDAGPPPYSGHGKVTSDD